jgi:hypothetical protein
LGVPAVGTARGDRYSGGGHDNEGGRAACDDPTLLTSPGSPVDAVERIRSDGHVKIAVVQDVADAALELVV